MIEDQYLVRDSLSKEFKNREQQLSQGMFGLAHQHPMGGIVPGGGGGTPPPGRGGPPDDKGDDESEEEDEEDDTDEGNCVSNL